MWASNNGRTDIAAFLLQLPAVKATIDHINGDQDTVLSRASYHGRQPIVQLLLDTGADPTIPAGQRSPLNRAIMMDHHAIAALRHPIAMADTARALHKARSLLGAGAAALACLQGRVEQGQAMPQMEVITFERHRQHQQQLSQHLLQLQRLLPHLLPLQQLLQERQEHQEHQHLLQLQQSQDALQGLLQRWQGEGHEKLRAAAAFVVGVSGGEKDTGLCEDLYLKLLGYMPAWADKEPEA